MHHSLHSETEDGLGVADGVSACDGASGPGDHVGSGSKDRSNRSVREMLGERRDVDGEHDAAAHRKDVAAGVCRSDRPEVVRVIDQRREEIGGADEGDIIREPVHGRVVERGESDQQTVVESGGQLLHEVSKKRSTPLCGTPSATRPLGELDVVGTE